MPSNHRTLNGMDYTQPLQQGGRIPRRPYGTQGDELSIVGFGSILLVMHEQTHANRLVAEAVEAGINYFDVAPSYGDVFGVRGDAEVKLGPALKPYRTESFLACKTGCRDRASAELEFATSLERLQTDYFDLYQLHAITDVKRDVDGAFMKGGVMEMIEEKRRSGQIRHVGFSAHSTEAALAAMDRYPFDSVLFPVNFASWKGGGFGRRIMERAREIGASRLAIKALAYDRVPSGQKEEDFIRCWYHPISPDERTLASMALRWTLSRPVTAAVCPGDERLFRLAVTILREDVGEDGNVSVTPDEEQFLQQLVHQIEPVFPLDGRS